MNPKTFRVVFFQPYGSEIGSLLSKNVYSFNIHVPDYQAAQDWVARVFPGIDIHDGSVHIIDRDSIKKHKLVDGKRILVETPEGYSRRTPKDVASSLFKLISMINKDYIECVNIAEHSLRRYKQFKIQSCHDRAIAAKEASKLASTWMTNVMKECLALQQSILVSI
jgi:hypothetical protein